LTTFQEGEVTEEAIQEAIAVLERHGFSEADVLEAIKITRSANIEKLGAYFTEVSHLIIERLPSKSRGRGSSG
jgi:hypothetical protein